MSFARTAAAGLLMLGAGMNGSSAQIPPPAPPPLALSQPAVPPPAASQPSAPQPSASQPPGPESVPPPAEAAPAPPLRVMTESAEYCGYLAREVAHAWAAAVSPSPDADMLRMEGERMCGRGHVRGGIARLRRALLILRSGQ
jgi:hypothetical protein